MRHFVTLRYRKKFTVLMQSESVQLATMVLKTGERSGEDSHNEHPLAEQWLIVMSGSGTARVGSRSVKIKAGSVLLIQKRERHLITATSKEPLVTVNLYAPPAYSKDGEVLRRAKR